MAQLHFQAVRREESQCFVGPFNGDDSRSGQIVIETDRFRVSQRIDTIQIEMGQREPATILVEEHECRAAHRFCGRAEPCGDSADQRGFSCSKRTG